MKTLAQKGMVILLLFIDTAIAQEINDLIPNDSITTDSSGVYVIKTPTEQEEESPDWQSVFVAPMGPDLDYNSSEFQAERKKTLLKIMLDRGLLPRDIELEFFASRRSAQEDLEFYSLCLTAHQRALIEGKDVNFYIEEIKAGRYSIERLKRDVEACGTGFELYEGSGICNQFPSHVSAEQNYYHCSLNNYQLLLENADLKRQLEVRNIPNFADGANKGRLWKPEADPKARCKGGTTILLEIGNPATSIDILDTNLVKIKSPANFGKLDDGRPRFCAQGMNGASFGKGPIFIQVGDNLFRVNNPANRED